jgi:signal transduction histidine kinase
MFKPGAGRPPKASFASVLALCLLFALDCPAQSVNPIVISRVTMDGKSVPFRPSQNVDLGSSPREVAFYMSPAYSNRPPPLRWRARLEGYDGAWREGGGFMYLGVRFFNAADELIDQTNLLVSGESPGWTGSVKTSSLTHRREILIPPPNARKVSVVLSSAGPPTTVGIYLVADLVLTAVSANAAPLVMIKSPFDQPAQTNAPATEPPSDWIRDGTRPAMAKVIQFGRDLSVNALAIEDTDARTHAEWRYRRASPDLRPGDQLVLEWNEMYSIGITDFRYTTYPGLPAGNYRFRVIGVDLMGNPDGSETSLAIYVPPPIWKRLWFWATMLVLSTAMVVGGARYVVWQRLRREMARLKAQQELTSERLRIAHDIHDDLGARVTQITMVSAMALNDTDLAAKTRADLEQIKQMSRDLISALYETVWAVNPANDNLEALGSYLCQMVSQMCDRTQYHCRLHVSDLPQERQVSSQVRHNITLSVKEAVHNVIKHARGSEITMVMRLNNQVLEIEIKDNGCGFQPANAARGNGLTNMRQRMSDIGGDCSILSESGSGSAVRLQWNIDHKAKTNGA